jgi:hypothetical protein
LLQVVGEEQEGAEHSDADDRDHQTGGAPVPVAHDPHRQQGLVDPGLDPHGQRWEQHAGDERPTTAPDLWALRTEVRATPAAPRGRPGRDRRPPGDDHDPDHR